MFAPWVRGRQSHLCCMSIYMYVYAHLTVKLTWLDLKLEYSITTSKLLFGATSHFGRRSESGWGCTSAVISSNPGKKSNLLNLLTNFTVDLSNGNKCDVKYKGGTKPSGILLVFVCYNKTTWAISSPLCEDLRELQRAVGDGRDEVEGRGAQVGALDELVQTLQQIIDHTRGVTGHQHVAPRSDRHGCTENDDDKRWCQYNFSLSPSLPL